MSFVVETIPNQRRISRNVGPAIKQRHLRTQLTAFQTRIDVIAFLSSRKETPFFVVFAFEFSKFYTQTCQKPNRHNPTIPVAVEGRGDQQVTLMMTARNPLPLVRYQYRQAPLLLWISDLVTNATQLTHRDSTRICSMKHKFYT